MVDSLPKYSVYAERTADYYGGYDSVTNKLHEIAKLRKWWNKVTYYIVDATPQRNSAHANVLIIMN